MKLENQIDDYHSVLLHMASRVRKMMIKALDALVAGDKESALKVIEMDDYVNHDDNDINERAIEVLSLLQPVAKDLRLIIAGIRISTDLERIGDYAKNIAKYIIRNDIHSSLLTDEMVEVGQLFLKNFDEAITALREFDVDLAFNAPNNDDLLDDKFKRIGKQMEALIKESSVPFPLATFSILRNLERAGDHTKNICESVIYAVKGQNIDFG